MKICHVISGDLWAGAEVQAYTLLRGLKEHKGADVEAVVLNPGRLYDKLSETEIPVHLVDENRNGYGGIKRILIGIFDQIKPDIVHTHRYKENILGATAAKECNISHLVQTVHGIHEALKGFKQLKMRFYMFLNIRLTRRHFSKIIAVSGDIENTLKLTYEAEKIVTIHNAIDFSSVRPSRDASHLRKEFSIPDNHRIIGTSGRLVPIKGFDILLAAVRIILKDHPATSIVIAGDGPLKSELVDLSRDLGVFENVVFTGFRDDIYDIVNMFDIFVVSSFHEGIPMSVLEAMALSKPIVSTNVGGMIEIIEDGDSGLFADARDSGALAAQCGRLLDDLSLLERIGEGARERVSNEFSAEILTEKMFSLYQSVMARS